MSKYLTNFTPDNIPDGQPVIITGVITQCRIINYWPPTTETVVRDGQTTYPNPHPSQSLSLKNFNIIPYVLEQNPNSPDYQAAQAQATTMANIINLTKVKTDKKTGELTYRWYNTLYQNNDGSMPSLIPLFHRQPDGTVKQIEWEHDLAIGTNVSIVVIPRKRGQSQIAQIGQHIVIEQPTFEWYTKPASQFTADMLGLDPTTIHTASVPLLYNTQEINSQTSQTQSYGQTQPNNAYGQTQPNNAYGQTQPNNAYGQTQQNVAQPYGQTQQNVAQPYGQTQPNNAYGQQTTQAQPYGQQNVAQPNNVYGQQTTQAQPYGQQNIAQPNNVYGQTQQNVAQPNNAYGQTQQNVAQPYGQTQPNNAYGQQTTQAQPYGQQNVAQPNNVYGQQTTQAQPYGQAQPNNAYGQTQPSENFMNVPESGLPFN